MNKQISVIREALEVAHDESLDGREFRCRQTLMGQIAALAELEAMAGEQEPAAWQGAHDPTDLYFTKPPQADVHPLYRAAPVAQQPQATCITITHAQAAELMLMFSDAEPDTEITLLTGDGHSGPGLYAYYEEYPEEGAEKLDATELPAQQPQAEAITEAAIDAYLDDYEMRGETEDGRDACYTPSEGEKFLIKDAIMGLLAEIPPKQPQAEAVPPTLTPAGQRWADDAAVESRKDQS